MNAHLAFALERYLHCTEQSADPIIPRSPPPMLGLDDPSNDTLGDTITEDANIVTAAGAKGGRYTEWFFGAGILNVLGLLQAA